MSYPNDEWLTRSNEETLYHLERQGRTSPGLVPFLGAGLSQGFGYKNWSKILLNATPPQLATQVNKKLDDKKFEEAAEILLRGLGADGFQNMVAASAGDTKLDAAVFSVGTVSLLPLLATGPVITTNFDRVLERAFKENGIPFESVISGPRPDLIVDALHGNRRVLIKLHGDWQDRVGRTFAKSDYDANYGKAQPQQKRVLLASAEALLFSSRSMLFIGASLAQDRTVEQLKKVHRTFAGIRHFAIMGLPKTKEEFHKTERHLRKCGVLPLWYKVEANEEHGPQVEKLVSSVIERISVLTIAKPGAQQPNPSRFAAPSVQIKPAVLQRVREPNAHFDRVIRLIEDGRLTFFLGSAIHHPTQLMARQFYAELARLFECQALGEDRSAVAQYIADRHGREHLYAEIQKLLGRTAFKLRATHKLFAAWNEFKTDTGRRIPYPMVFTTNYDDLLEQCLMEAGLPYDLLSYQTDGPHRGLFYHQSTDNGLRIIERPRNIQKLSDDAFIVVKLNGGLDHQGRIPESYATTHLDYWDLATGIPGILPAVVQRKLAANPLLFLGHGLAMPDIEAIIRFAHKNHPGPRSWAVVLDKSRIEYWRQCGVKILPKDVNRYVNELHDRLAAPRKR